MKNHRLIYTTEKIDKEISVKTKVQPSSTFPKYVYLHLDRKGGGKVVTVIKGLSIKNDKMLALSKELKKRCGSGGSVKDNNILIQGNKREGIKKILLNKGFHVKLSGGWTIWIIT